MAFIKQIKVGNNTYDIHKKVTVTIAAADWTAATIDKTVSGMTVNDIVVVSPAPSSIIGARNSVVYCSAIKAGALSFTYNVSKPTTALTFNVLWVQAATTDTDKGAIINTVMGGKIPTGTLNVSSTLSNYDTYLNNVRYINLGAGTIDVADKTVTPKALTGAWDATKKKYVVSQAKKTGETMQSTVTTAGYVSSTVGTKNTGTLTINAPANLEIAKATFTVSDNIVKSDAAGYIPANTEVGTVSTVARASTTISTTANTTDAKLTVTASNNQGTGYVTGSNKTASDTITLSVSGATVTATSGNDSTKKVSKSVASGTAGTPTATKGTVSNHSIAVTPSVTNTTGYITGGTKSGTAVTVAASELVSGNKALSSSASDQTNIDVTNYKTVSISKIPTITPVFDGGALSGNNISGSQTKGSVTISESGTFFADAAKTNFGVTTEPPSGTDGTNYLTVHEAHSTASGKATGSTTITRGAVLYNGAATGYVDQADNTQALASGSKDVSASITVTPSVVDNFEPHYIPVSAASASATAGTATATAGTTSTTGLTAGTYQTTATSGYTYSITATGGSASATGGDASASVSKGVTSGATKNATGASTGTKTGASATIYLIKATITNNTSGGDSADTIDRGKQIKIGAGYNPTDLYYTAEDAPTLIGNAAADNVLSGKTFYSNSYTKHTGTMANNGSTGGTISTKAGTVSIPAGYTTGGSVSISTTEQNKIVAGNIKSGVTILGVAGTYTNDATATAANILSGKTAYVNGAKITGSMVNWGLVSPTLGLGQSYILEEGYYEGGEILVIPGQAKSPTEITVGTAITADTGYGLSSVTIPSNATITVGEENKLNIIVPRMSSPMVTYSSKSNDGGEATALNAIVGGASLNRLDIKDEATASVTIFSGSLNISRISGIVHSEDLISSNIRKGSSILGVVGTYAASSTASDIYKAQYAGNISSGWSIYWSSFDGNMHSNSEFTETLSTPIPQGAKVRLKYDEFGPNANSGAGFSVYLVSAGGTTQLIASPSAYTAVNGPHNSSEITSNFVATRIKVAKYSAGGGETVSTYQLLAVEVYVNVPNGYYGVTATSGGSTLADVSSYQYMAVKKATLGNTYTPSTSSQSVKVKGEGWVKASDTVATISAVPTETKTVTLSLASGNQTVRANSGKYMTSVTINKPSTLVAGNIKSGVTIAGVTGTYSAPPAADPAVKFLGLYLYTQRGSAANPAVLENVTGCQFAEVNRRFGASAYVGCFGLFAFKGTPTIKPCLFDADGLVIGESSAVPLSKLLNDPYVSRTVSLYNLLDGITKYEQNIDYNQIYLAPMALTTNANDWGPSSPYYWQAMGVGDSSSTYVYIKNLGSKCISLNYND